MTANDNTDMTPHDLLHRIHEEREALAALWCGLTREQMTRRPGPQEELVCQGFDRTYNMVGKLHSGARDRTDRRGKIRTGRTSRCAQRAGP